MAAKDRARLLDDEGSLPGDAGRYVTVLVEEMQRQPEWQTEAELLMRPLEGRVAHRAQRDICEEGTVF